MSPSLPTSALSVHFKHTFVTHPTEISRFSITVTPPPRGTVCHPPPPTPPNILNVHQERIELAFNSLMTSVYRGSEPDQIVDGMIASMKFQIENPALLNSRFVFDEFLYLDVNFHQLNLMRGSSYLPLPDWLASKKAIVNPHNDDEECFKWSVIAAENAGMKDPQRVSNLSKFIDNYDWSGLEFPVSTKDIGKFETRNNISVNVLAVEGRDIYIHRKGRRMMSREINLLMASKDGIRHYTAIKSLSRLLSSKNSNTKRKQHFSMNCLQGFTQESSRDQHQVYCEDNESVRVEMPKQGSTVEFKDGQNQFKVSFIMYADFESILEPMDHGSPNPNQPYTNEVNQHTPSGWCVYSKFAYGEVVTPLRTYRGKDCIETFCNYIKGEAHRLYHMFPELPMDPLIKKQWKKYKRSTKCHICYKPFTQTDQKARGHCHYTGLYRGPAHSLCNLRYKIPSYIPVVFHNLSGYDAHLFIRELGDHASDMEVIAKNKEDYISFSIKVPVDSYIDKNGEEKDKLIELRFIDSFKFMSSSLDSLTKNLVRGGKKLFGFEDYSELQYGLLTRKGVYPYEYINSWDRFEETQLPPMNAFYSNLNMSSISEEDYQHAQRVWKEFGIHNLGDYHDLYLRTDVVLLANMFEAFRDTCLKHYKLDPAHFYTSPGLAWCACLKRTGIELELLTDPDMLLMFERGIRGRITQAVRKYASANNKYMSPVGSGSHSDPMGDRFDPKSENSYLQYLDANNLYGCAMSQPLPAGGFKWVDVNPNEISELATRTDKGYVLEVDVSYPKELHNSHNDLPFMCERMEINGVEKLVPNLRDKKSYVVHIQALNQVLQHGLRLDRIHRVIEFDQLPWLKTYIDFNTQLRTAATNDFEKDFFKLMNNSVFGKMMENIRKRRNIKLVMTEEKYLHTVMHLNFKSGVLFGENLVGCETGKTKVVMNKPVYLGQVILDLSKIIMYEFHYDYMVPKYSDRLKLCHMDTDSLVYHIKTEDFYAGITDDVQTRFDTSGYTLDSPLPVGLNKKVIGLMKDELGGQIMTEFVALRPILYFYKKLDGLEDKKCKGIKKCVVKKTLTFEDYKTCLFNDSTEYRSQLMFRSSKHKVHTIEVNNVTLNRDDDKRISRKDGISTFGRGHKDLSWSPLLGELSLI